MRDLMIDLETMGRPPDGAIIAIGAAFFDLETGNVNGTFDLPISLVSACNLGMQIHPQTVMWWFQQSQEAIASWNTVDHVPILTALDEFVAWVRRNAFDSRSLRVWAKSPTFDLAILHHAAQLADLSMPWHFRQERCVRTHLELAFERDPRLRDVPREGIVHGAISDCLNQIRLCHEAWKVLMK